MKKLMNYLSENLGFDEILMIDRKDLSQKIIKVMKPTTWSLFVLTNALIFSLLLILFAWKATESSKYKKIADELTTESESYNHDLTMYRDSCIKLSIEYEEELRLDKLLRKMCDVTVSGKCCQVNKDTLWSYILECDPWFPDLIMMQAVQESGVGTSNVAKHCNNLFGMKKPYRRTLRADKNRDNKSEQYMEFENWKLSVIDRIFWDEWTFSGKKPTRSEYLNMIQSSYNTETPDYAYTLNENARVYRELLNK